MADRTIGICLEFCNNRRPDSATGGERWRKYDRPRILTVSTSGSRDLQMYRREIILQ